MTRQRRDPGVSAALLFLIFLFVDDEAHGPSFEIRFSVLHEIGWPPKVGEGTDTSAVE